jgi:hypothetical protein
MRRRHASRAALIAALVALWGMPETALADTDDAQDTEPVETALPPPPGAPPRQDQICARLDALLRESADSPERRKAAATRDAIHCSAAGSSVPRPRREGEEAK